jgi:hypothetical protein
MATSSFNFFKKDKCPWYKKAKKSLKSDNVCALPKISGSPNDDIVTCGECKIKMTKSAFLKHFERIHGDNNMSSKINRSEMSSDCGICQSTMNITDDSGGEDCLERIPINNSNGALYIAEQYGHRICKISTSAVVTTCAGSGSASYSNGIGTNAAMIQIPTKTLAKKYLPQELTEIGSKIYTSGFLLSGLAEIIPFK